MVPNLSACHGSCATDVRVGLVGGGTTGGSCDIQHSIDYTFRNRCIERQVERMVPSIEKSIKSLSLVCVRSGSAATYPSNISRL